MGQYHTYNNNAIQGKPLDPAYNGGTAETRVPVFDIMANEYMSQKQDEFFKKANEYV